MLNKEVFDNKFIHFWNALQTLKYSVIQAKINEKDEKLFPLLRDSVIQRFEYTYELSWKFMKYLWRYNENEIETITSYQAIKIAFKAWYIDDMKKWFKMIDYRNKTSREYMENIANDLYFEINWYLNEIQKFYDLIKLKYGQWYFIFDN